MTVTIRPPPAVCKGVQRAGRVHIPILDDDDLRSILKGSDSLRRRTSARDHQRAGEGVVNSGPAGSSALRVTTAIVAASGQAPFLPLGALLFRWPVAAVALHPYCVRDHHSADLLAAGVLHPVERVEVDLVRGWQWQQAAHAADLSGSGCGQRCRAHPRPWTGTAAPRMGADAEQEAHDLGDLLEGYPSREVGIWLAARRLAGVSMMLGRMALQRTPKSAYSASSAWM